MTVVVLSSCDLIHVPLVLAYNLVSHFWVVTIFYKYIFCIISFLLLIPLLDGPRCRNTLDMNFTVLI